MPKEIKHLAHDTLNCPVTVQVDNAISAATVSHALYPVKQHLKISLLLELLHHTDTESVLIFTRTKHRAKCLGEHLKNADYRATTLQGNLSQQQRQAALGGFRDGTFQILVATDIASRGIDVSQISHVINFDIPNTPLAYVHRIGRTGRAARSGDAFTLVTNDDKATVLGVEQILGSPIERRILENFDYSAPATKTTSMRDNTRRQQMPRRKVDGSQKRGTKARSVSPKGSSKATAHGRTKQHSGKPDHTTKVPTSRFKRARRAR
jgi:ATP-dependent RNA helicase RhlE